MIKISACYFPEMLILLFLVLSFPSFGNELKELPVNYMGRFRPLEVYYHLNNTDPALKYVPDPALKVLPTTHEWLPLNQLKKERNPTLFSNQEWKNLKEAYSAWEKGDGKLFAETYFKAYKKLSLFPSRGQLKVEILFYKWPLTSYAIWGYLISMVFFFLAYGISSHFLKISAWISIGIAFTMHTLLLAARIYILMRPPVSSMAETVIYVPWITIILGIYLSQKLRALFPVILASGIAVSLLSILQWTFTPYHFENVQAVLNSQLWLITHVLMIVASYGVLIFGGTLGHMLLIRPNEKLEEALITSLYIGIALLIPGTILGGVWAAQSWGRFWDWDPKESWAFISACVYLLVIHAYRFKKIGAKGLAIGSIFGLLAISFTWYGVNYILGTGLHSYGFGSGGEWIYFSYVGLELLFMFLFSFKNSGFLKYKFDK